MDTTLTSLLFFTEADILFQKATAKVGLRASYNDLLEELFRHEFLWRIKCLKTVNSPLLMETFTKSQRRLYQIFKITSV
jgi:hypothetical protein